MNIIWRPLLFSVVLAWLWNGYSRYVGIDPEIKADETIMVGATIVTLGVFYALMAAFVLAAVWQQWVTVEEAVNSDDKPAFLKHARKRIPGTIKLLILIFSTLLLGGFFFLAAFKSAWAGSFSIFAISLILSIYWAVVTDLDDPLTGVWNVSRVPKNWVDGLKYLDKIA